jgi:methyl-accepting chemotaxis protein
MKINLFAKQIGSFLVIVAILAGFGIFARVQLGSLNQQSNYVIKDSIPSIQTIHEITLLVTNYRQAQLQHLVASSDQEMTTYETAMQDTIVKVSGLFDTYQGMVSDTQDDQYLATVGTLWNTYVQQSSAFVSPSRSLDSIRAKKILNTDAKDTYDQLNDTLEQWANYNQEVAEGRSTSVEKVYHSSQDISLIIIVIAVIIAVGLGFVIARSVSTSAKLMMKTAKQISNVDLPALVAATQAMANGDLTQTFTTTTERLNFKSSDEMGQLAGGLNEMIDALQSCGQSFAVMNENLRSMFQQVVDSASGLNASSVQLASTANQSGQASSQIATTIQQVARGAAQQSDSVNQAVSSVEQMSTAIDEVAQGAQEQASMVNQASEVTAQISEAVHLIAENAKSQATTSAEAVETSRSSARFVEETIQGMKTIKNKVDVSTQKVQEMGHRSDQIGMIVETIDDIASQTNLLALNAAIEAARAGEHGKGFAVVADEVRKLAEKSANATKEIAGLIRGIQQIVAEAVKAMNESAREVDKGVALANQSGQSLASLLASSESGKRSGEEIAQSAAKMNELAQALVDSMTRVSAVVEKNTASTEKMTAGSSEVTYAIENIASVSEENSAAVEEVSASAEQMNAQVEEMAGYAQSLSEMAELLNQLVGRFKLTAEEIVPEEIVPIAE